MLLGGRVSSGYLVGGAVLAQVTWVGRVSSGYLGREAVELRLLGGRVSINDRKNTTTSHTDFNKPQ